MRRIRDSIDPSKAGFIDPNSTRMRKEPPTTETSGSTAAAEEHDGLDLGHVLRLRALPVTDPGPDSLRSLVGRSRRRPRGAQEPGSGIGETLATRSVAPGEGAAPAVRSSVLGNLIGRGEGDYGSFNRGRAGDSAGRSIDFSRMSLREIVRRQSLPRTDPNRLFAVGKYQVIPSTMQGAIRSMDLDLDLPLTPDLQERIFADYLIDEKRPQVKAYITGASRDLGAAQLALAREFAAVADPRTGRSYYDGVGNNSASITADEVAGALRTMRNQYARHIARGLSPTQAYDALRGVENSGGDSTGPVPEAGLRRGDRNDAVRALQARYVELGVMTQAEVDTGPGIFGPRTEAATRRFQRATGREATGRFDGETRAAMAGLFTGVQRGSDADRDLTRTLQGQLVALGHMTRAQVATGPGTFGPRTEAGLSAFQRNAGLMATGVLDTNTFRALQDALPTTNWPLPGFFAVNRADQPGEGDGEFGAPRSGGRRHNGIDIEAPVMSRVEPFAAGEVLLAGPVRGFGNTVIVQHDQDFQTVYAHLGNIDVRVGQSVTPDTRLARLGRTGNVPRAGDTHLHFEIREGATRTPLSGTPVNPRNHLQFPA